ncbi:hypothetical protein [Bartonella schoenbuchensis]|uniref:hypothetical protein n=1 Tax=Bartonella schoenbuchensis TaxID=165694 RepID=UPI001ABA3C7E|nr:hypothetical protein [Bartonella schoenbuchensis]
MSVWCAGREVCAGLIKGRGLRCGVGGQVVGALWVSVRGRGRIWGMGVEKVWALCRWG